MYDAIFTITSYLLAKFIAAYARLITYFGNFVFRFSILKHHIYTGSIVM
jgi:hypothetical protein